MSPARRSTKPESRRVRRRLPLVPASLAIALGEMADRWLDAPLAVWGWLAMAAAGAWCWPRRLRAVRVRWTSWWSGWGALGVAVAAGGAAHHIAWNWAASDDVALFATEQRAPTLLEGVALESPRARARDGRPAREDRYCLQMVARRLRDGREWRAVTGRLSVEIEGAPPRFEAGDRVWIAGALSRPPPTLNPGEFDELSWRREQGLLARLHCRGDAMRRVAIGVAWSPRRLLDRVRQRALAGLRRHVAPAQAPLAAALLLGLREGVDQETLDTFRLAGAMHLLAISGMHVAIVAGLFFAAGRGGLLGRRGVSAAAATTAVGYAALAGANAPVLRAAAQIVATGGARWLGRGQPLPQALAAAAVVIVSGRPCLLFNTGVQLSFLAVLALSWCGDLLPDRPPRDPLRRLLRESQSAPRRWLGALARGLARGVIASGCVWLATAPLVAWRFEFLAPIGVVVNPLIGPAVALALFSGLGVCALAWCPPLAAACGLVASGSLGWVRRVCEWGAAQGGAGWASPPPSAALVLFYTALVAATLWGRRWAPPLVATLGLLGTSLSVPVPGGGWTTTFLSVGHGTCVVVESPDRRVLVYDVGSLGDGARAFRAARGWLARRGVRRIAALVLSHPDADHYNGATRLLRTIPADMVWVGPRMFDDAGVEGLGELRRQLESSRTPVRVLAAGDRGMLGKLSWEAWHPPRQFEGDLTSQPAQERVWSDNADSLVLTISCHNRTMVLPGDIESPGVDTLPPWGRPPADIAMAPHHGSALGATERFYTWCRPRLVITSGASPRAPSDSFQRPTGQAGRLDPHDHPRQRYHTALDGAVRIDIDQAGVLRVRTWRRGGW